MSIYVDQEHNRFGRMIMCHMFADTAAELHEAAEAIGMRRSWYQPKSFPHYDVSLTRRAIVLRMGAIEVGRRDGCHLRKRIRERMAADPAFAAEWK